MSPEHRNITVTLAIFDTQIKPDQILTIQYENLVWFDLGTRLGTRLGRVNGSPNYATWSGPQAHSAAAIVVLPQMCLARRLRLCMRTAA